MNLEEEFVKYNHKFDLGDIESSVRLVSNGWDERSQKMITFTFRNFSRVLKINFHYSHKKEDFSLNIIKYAGSGSSEREWEAIESINRISIWEYSKFPRMNVEECFRLVERFVQGQRDVLDPVLLEKNIQIYMKLLDINKECR